MKRFFKWLLVVVGSLAAIFFIGGFLIPQVWQVTKTIVIKGDVDDIYVQVANLKNWQNWSPWNKETDKTQVYTYEGPELGQGARWLWTSQNMGKGYLEIKKAHPHQGINYELFIDMNDMQSTLIGDMTFKPHTDGVEVSWTDTGDSGNNLVKRWMSLMIRRVLGEEMETGLNRLKAVVEQESEE